MAGVLGCSLAVLAVLGIGYLAAPVGRRASPPSTPPTGRSPSSPAVVSAFPLDGRVSAALQGQPASTTAGAGYPTGGGAAREGDCRKPRPTKLLVQAGQAGDELTYTATQVVSLLPRRRADHQHRAGRAACGGAGTELSPGGSGHHAGRRRQLHRDRLVDPDGRRRPDRAPRRPLHAAGLEGPVVRRARPRTSSKRSSRRDRVRRKDRSSGVAARWWLDARTRLLLGQETYDGRGNVVVTIRLTDLRFGTRR